MDFSIASYNYNSWIEILTLLTVATRSLISPKLSCIYDTWPKVLCSAHNYNLLCSVLCSLFYWADLNSYALITTCMMV